MSAGTTVEKYGAVVTAVDVDTKVIEFALKTGLTRRMTLATYPDTFCWPQVGDQIMVRYENGQWNLEGWFDTEGVYQNVNPGDAVIRSTTDTLRVVGGNGWSLTPATWPLNTTAGGDLTGTYPNPTLAAIPYAYVYWNSTAINTSLVLINCVNVSFLRGGMTQSGGGVRVPKTGFYQVSVQARVDCALSGAAVANFTTLEVLVNGNVSAARTTDTSFIPSDMYQYHTLPINYIVLCNAGDIITVGAACTNPLGATVVIESGGGLFVTYVSA